MEIEIYRRILVNYCLDLGVKIISPYIINREFENLDCFAYIPDFGSTNGTVVGLTSSPNYFLDEATIAFCKKEKIFYSFINTERLKNYDIEKMKEMLVDWGYFGTEKDKPSWYEIQG